MAIESIQKHVISGKVYNIEHREGTGKGGVYIAGKVFVETDSDSVIPVNFYASEKKKDGTPNPMYSSLKTVVHDYKSIASSGREDADSVEVGLAKIEENTFFVKDGKMIRDWQFKSAFFNRKADVAPKAEFSVVGEVLDIEDEIINNVPTGNVKVRMLVVGYGNSANIIDFAVENEAAVKYVKSNFASSVEVKLTGDILVIEKIEEKITPTAFGEPIREESKRTERKLLVKSATPPVPSTLNEAELTTMLAEREAKITESKRKFLEKQKGTKPTGAADFSL